MERASLNHNIRYYLIILTIVVYIMAGAASIGSVTIYLALVCLSAIIGLMDLTRKNFRKNPPYEKSLYCICLLMAIFIVLSFSCNFIHFSVAFNRVLLIICCMCFSFLCANTLQSPDEMKRVCWAVIIPTTISALVVIGQGLNINIAYRFAKMLGAGSEIEVLSLSLKSERFYGLAKSALYFGYQASASVALLVFMPHEKERWWNSVFRIVTLCILIISLLFNRTRSAQISVALILLAKLLYSCLKPITRRSLLRGAALAFFIALCGAFLWKQLDVNELISALRLDELDHAGTTARIPMFLTAMISGLHHPFGMGIYRANPNYIVGVKNANEINYVLNNACHNLLANCVGNHGLFTGFLMIVLYMITFKECMFLRKLASGDLKKMSVGVELAIMALLINGAMHNLYILNGDLLSWLSFGLLIVIRKCLKLQEIQALHN